MANPAIGDVALTVAGARYTLRLDFNALCEVEAQAGRSVEAILDQPTMTETRLILWASLQRHHPGVTLTDAGDLLQADADACSAALVASMTAAAPEAEKPGARRTGKAAVGRQGR